jgi:V/A-type H+/Na+-transporting ATPase subunit A
MIREDFLQQSAYHDIDSFCSLEKQYWMLRVILSFYDRVNQAMGKGVPLVKILKLPVKTEIGRMKELSDIEKIKDMVPQIDGALSALEVER